MKAERRPTPFRGGRKRGGGQVIGRKRPLNWGSVDANEIPAGARRIIPLNPRRAPVSGLLHVPMQPVCGAALQQRMDEGKAHGP